MNRHCQKMMYNHTQPAQRHHRRRHRCRLLLVSLPGLAAALGLALLGLLLFQERRHVLVILLLLLQPPHT